MRAWTFRGRNWQRRFASAANSVGLNCKSYFFAVPYLRESIMSRIRDAYEAKFRRMLEQVHPRRLELGVQLLLERADRLSERQGISLPRALAQVYDRTRE